MNVGDCPECGVILDPDGTCRDPSHDATVAWKAANANGHRPRQKADRAPRPEADNPAPGPPERPPRITSWSAADLMAAEFPEPRWAVPGVIAEGAMLLAGPPKAGKSWLALGLAVATAAGGKALGRIAVDPGPVIYYALEDTGRRLKERLAAVLGPADPPAGLTLATTCRPLPLGGADDITEWVKGHGGARLVIIDVLARVRGPVNREMSPYESDYRAMAWPKMIADSLGVAVVVIHHARKAGADDFIDLVSGTSGLTAAADSVAVLTRVRGTPEGTLAVTGRDIDEQTFALRFAADLGAWCMLDGAEAREVTMHTTRRAILRYLIAEGAELGPRAIAEGAGIGYATVKKTVQRMEAAGQLEAAPGGTYRAVAVPGVPGVPGVPESPGQGTLPLGDD